MTFRHEGTRLCVHMYLCMCLEVSMPQLHLYVPEKVAASIRRRADSAGLSVSAYLAQVVVREVSDAWPARFFVDVVGGWNGEPLVRGPQGKLEKRARL